MSNQWQKEHASSPATLQKEHYFHSQFCTTRNSLLKGILHPIFHQCTVGSLWTENGDRSTFMTTGCRTTLFWPKPQIPACSQERSWQQARVNFQYRASWNNTDHSDNKRHLTSTLDLFQKSLEKWYSSLTRSRTDSACTSSSIFL